MSNVRIAAATAEDATDLDALRRALWPDAGDAATADLALLARDAAGTAIGFAEASVRREYVNGCDTSPVAFLEGLYVDPEHRRLGVARALIARVAEWARAKSLSELASDAPLDNTASHAVHHAAGFDETERVICFRRLL